MWPVADQRQYQGILAQADRVIHVGHEYTRASLQSHTHYILETVTHLVAVYDGKPGDIKQAIDYARGKGVEIIIIEP